MMKSEFEIATRRLRGKRGVMGWAKGYYTAKQEEGVYLIDVPFNELDPGEQHAILHKAALVYGCADELERAVLKL